MIWVWIFIGIFLFLFLIPTMIMAWYLYSILFRRTSPEKWGRSCAFPEDKEYQKMFDVGMKWAGKHTDVRQEVSITSDGLKLVGEYFDFGFDRATIIIAGRTESLLYSYYFAAPFQQSGYNILVIDNRAHGLSEGKVSSLGYKEYRDIIAWCKMLHGRFGNKAVFLHGICIGASTALFAAVSKYCPDYVIGLSVEGMYVNFYQSFLNHMKVDRPNRIRFPVMQEVMFHLWVFSGANVVTDGPIKRIRRLNKPILMLHSREDLYSRPEKAQLLYDICPAPKRLVWFDHGAHSRIRINNTERYDASIIQFLSELSK